MTLPDLRRPRLVLSVAFVAVLLARAIPCTADVLDPGAFPSLGTLTGGFLIDSGNGVSAPVIRDSSGNVLATGVISNGVAVFDFNSVNVTGSLLAQGVLPIAILSRGDLTLGGLQEIAPVPTYFVNPGSGGGGGASGGQGAAGGPGPLDEPGGPGGSGAGNLLKTLLGGQNETSVIPQPQAFGAGGAAFELVATGNLQVGGIKASGVTGFGAQGFSTGAGGGGGGGGILLSANSVTITGILDVSGGAGGNGTVAGGPGGGGGGGAIDILYGPGGFSNQGSFDVVGGAGGIGFSGGQAGSAGSVTAVPEPSAVALLALGLVGLCGARRKRSVVQGCPTTRRRRP